MKTFKPLILIILFFSITYQAQANLALSKYRLYFDSSNRTDSLQIRNSGAVAFDYQVKLGLTAMTEEGTVYNIDEDPLSAIDMLRYSPKRGTLEAGERQAIRFALRKPAGLADGEYRATLKITSTPKSDGVSSASRNTLSYGLPIIVRHGKVTASTELLDPQLVMRSDIPHVEFWQTRQGNRSLFGNFIVSDVQGNELGIYKNSSIYLPLSRRKISIGLNKKVEGKVLIEYKEIAGFGGDQTAKTEVELK